MKREQLSFTTRFPKTALCLETAQGPVFPAFSTAIYFKNQRWFHWNGCGRSTFFDLASLTKPLATATICALAEEKGLLNSEDPIQNTLPQFPSDKVTIGHLLDHTAGFPAWLPLHDFFHDKNGRGSFDHMKTPALARIHYEKQIIASWLPDQWQKSCLYSDLGFMLLGWILEKICKMPLDALFQEWIAHPLGYKQLQFIPITPDVAPTEDCPWRGHVLRGEVHDDNCYVLGGIAGHAGLFGTASEVLNLALQWLPSPLRPSGEPALLSNAIIEKYWNTRHLANSVRSLGWDGIAPPAADGVTSSSAGQYFSVNTRGHLGYTGNSLWIDPDKELVVVLLTNRVHPTRTNEAIKQFRPEFHNAVLNDLGFS